MEDYDSDVELGIDLDSKSDIGDDELKNDIEEQLGHSEDDAEEIDVAELELSDDDADRTDMEETDADEPDEKTSHVAAPMIISQAEPEEPDISAAGDKIQVRQLIRPEDSRMPDIPSLFEVTGLIISRACTLMGNSQPLVPYVKYNPADIARAELLAHKSMRSVLRGNSEWKWTDFAYFPRGFISSVEETTDSLHRVT
jgi:hypothetical protein